MWDVGHGIWEEPDQLWIRADTSESFGAMGSGIETESEIASVVLRPLPVMQSTTSSSADNLPLFASARAAATVTPAAVSPKIPVVSASNRMPSTTSASVTAAAQPPDERIACDAERPSAGFPIASDLAIVDGFTGTRLSPPLSTRRTIGAQPSACAP